MHQRAGHQQLGILGGQHCGQATRRVGNYLNMGPAVAQGCDQAFRLRGCPCFQGHGATIPCALDRAQAVLFSA
jgi:hypothetical protein